MLIRALLSAVCLCSISWHSAALETITTSAELAAVESSAKVHALLVLATEEKAQDLSLEELAIKAYPTLPDIEKELEGLVTFGVVDIAPHRKDAVGNKWQLAKLPAFVIYKDLPKENPYTGKMYRDSKATDVAILDNPRKLKRMLKQAIPTELVQELEGDAATLTSFKKLVEEKVESEEKVALLISKQKHAPPMYRALATEFNNHGLNFVFLNKEQEGAAEIMKTLKVEELPGMVMLRSMTEHVVLRAENTKTYKELKGFVEPFATLKSEASGAKSKEKRKEDSKFIRA
ncbi:Hypothetical protein PHPALM_10359 [Phytophthora palmivora]|uniref:Uncharacterized protein n=1 Tax=Phytophthora palmivora TaxID=4796 RepID=A0A2P4Y4Y5_9STRA|nr:Hypothetical protein PHPALM_10359 [Phytophthora palmivora]